MLPHEIWSEIALFAYSKDFLNLRRVIKAISGDNVSIAFATKNIQIDVAEFMSKYGFIRTLPEDMRTDYQIMRHDYETMFRFVRSYEIFIVDLLSELKKSRKYHTEIRKQRTGADDARRGVPWRSYDSRLDPSWLVEYCVTYRKQRWSEIEDYLEHFRDRWSTYIKSVKNKIDG